MQLRNPNVTTILRTVRFLYSRYFIFPLGRRKASTVICCIASREGVIQYLSMVHPSYPARGVTRENLLGTSIWDHIKTNIPEVELAVQTKGFDPTCVEVVISIKGLASRWILSIDPVLDDQIIIMCTSIPFNTPNLTAREMEVFGLISQGMSSVDIGHRLGILSSTVDKHRVKIKAELHLSREHELQLASRQFTNREALFFAAKKDE